MDGTGECGTDVPARVIWGTRVPLEVGLIAVVIGFIVGVPLGRRLGYLCFFFQAEDGIRDLTVTGVQTCALPISLDRWLARCCKPRQSQARTAFAARYSSTCATMPSMPPTGLLSKICPCAGTSLADPLVGRS